MGVYEGALAYTVVTPYMWLFKVIKIKWHKAITSSTVVDIFQKPKAHTWLVAAVLDSEGVDCCCGKFYQTELPTDRSFI